MLKFIITGQTIKRTDTDKLVQYAQVYPEADFNFDSDWDGLEKTAQWNMADETYDTPIKDGRAVVPWELLRSRGILNVNVVGVAENKIITTNTVSINVMSCGVVGGMVSGKPSESFYAALKTLIGKHEDYINGLENDRKDSFSINDLLVKGDIVQKDGISIISDGTDDERAVVDIDPETGIRILNNMPKDQDWYIKIGQGDEKGDIQYGIMYRADNGDFWVMCNGIPILCLTPNNSGTKNIINGNETLKISAGNGGYLSFDTENAGINYTAATWTEIFKQLDVTLTKGVNMEAQNNSYWWVNAPKKAQYGNSLNKLEFRTDGVAKFSNVVNASDYQISGKSIKEQFTDMNSSITNLENRLIDVKITGLGYDTDDEYLGSTLVGVYSDDYTYYVSLNMSLKPNKVYVINNQTWKSNWYTYMSILNISLRQHNYNDIFQLRFRLCNGYADELGESIPAAINLPSGVIWKDNTPPSIISGASYVLSITQGIAKLEKYGELTADTMYLGGLYAAIPILYYEFADFICTDMSDPFYTLYFK